MNACDHKPTKEFNLVQSVTPSRTKDGFLPLEHYAVIGGGKSAAMIGVDGSVDWWCVPDIDSLPLFDRLTDGDNGAYFTITPNVPFSIMREYRKNSTTVETTFITSTGRAILTDNCNQTIGGRLPWSELARRIEGIMGQITFEITLKFGTRGSSARPWKEPNPHADVFHIGDLAAVFVSTPNVRITASGDEKLAAVLTTSPNSRDVIGFVITDDAPVIIPKIEDIDKRIEFTHRQWVMWAEQICYEGPYKEIVVRSALTLKLLFTPAGSITAAATTSLPERIGGDKNFDYRYAWIRDVAYTTKAFVRCGALADGQAAFTWLKNVIYKHGPELQVLYTLDGKMLEQEEIEVNVTGYKHSTPVRIGNRAKDQRQLSMYGDLLETAWLFIEQGHILDQCTGEHLRQVTNQCVDAWQKKDSGMWELEEEQHYTMSKIGCWLALDRAAKLSKAGHMLVHKTMADRWERERDRIRDWIDEHCWSETKQSYTFYAGTDRLDASLLLATRFQFERMDRLNLTRIAIQKELCRGPLVYRYSGAEKEEGCFIACCFWLVEAYAFCGFPEEATKTMDTLVTLICEKNLGLMNEMIDPTTGEMLGNFPQGLSHLACIHAADAIQRCKKK